MNTLPALVALCLTPGVGGVTLRNLLNRFSDVEAILAAPADALTAVPGIGKRTAAAIKQADVIRTTTELAHWQQQGINVLTWAHPRYPAALRRLHDAPPILFCRGSLETADQRAVGIVGTRRPTPAARRFAETLAAELATRGWTIISGLAWGVDYAAHAGAVRHGRTVAFLGSGIMQVPRKKHAIAGKIVAQGALLSEVHPATAPNPAALVARNRLISGMSQAVFVIEADEDSGSLYTARFAHKQGRPVYAVKNGSAGNARLLAGGATALEAGFSDWDSLHKELAGISPGS